MIFDVLAPPVDNRQRDHHYPQLSAKEEIKSPAIVVNASCNTLLTSLKDVYSIKRSLLFRLNFLWIMGICLAFQRRYAARRPEWSLCSQVSTRQMPGRVANRNLQAGFFFAPPCFSPPSQRLGRKSMMDDVTNNTPVRRQGCDTHP